MRIIYALCFFLVLTDSFSQKNNSKSTRPNIIYIYADDLGYGELGAYGQEKIKTPHLDKLANEGMKFTQHYTSAPVCAPARCMLLTGKHGGNSYIRGNYELGGYTDETEGGQMPLPEGTITAASLLKSKGYKTAAIGKWGMGMVQTSGHPNLQGFDYFYGYLCQKQAHNFYPTHLWENDLWDSLNNPYIAVHTRLDSTENDPNVFAAFQSKDYAPDRMQQKTLQFIQENKNNPFFLYIPTTIPHVSLQVPDEALNVYKGQFDDTPYRGQRSYAPNLHPKETYAAMITYMDKQVGEIMELLKKLKLDENTIVMFSSDNGPTFNVGGVDAEFFNSSAGLRGRKMDLYEGGIREPFIARWPGKIKAGSVSDLISIQYDFLATVCDIVGIKTPKTDGISFLPELLGNANAQLKHEFLYFEYPEKNGQVAIRLGDWKGVRRNVKIDKSAPWELYNLKTDVYETRDVAQQHPEIVSKMNAIQKREHRHSHVHEWEFIDPRFQINK